MNIAKGFVNVIPVSGLILKIDGDARGGAAISIREVTGITISSRYWRRFDALEVRPDPPRASWAWDMLGDRKASRHFEQMDLKKLNGC